MPVYEYQCDSCGLRAEKLWKRVSIAKDSIPCEACGTDMRKLVTSANFAFKHGASQTRGALPPSTGTSDDYNFDKAIGRDAEQKWRQVEQREAVKSRHIRHEREAGRLVTRDHLVPKLDGSGEYRTITESERVATNANRETAFQIAQAAKAAKGSGDPGGGKSDP
jgi:putative FmdB family regulatory protein